jgi:hypothetical protein
MRKYVNLIILDPQNTCQAEFDPFNNSSSGFPQHPTICSETEFLYHGAVNVLSAFIVTLTLKLACPVQQVNSVF